MKLLDSSADVELGASVNEQQSLPPQGTEGIERGRDPPRRRLRLLNRVNTSYHLHDKEIEDLWNYTFRNQPCPSKTDEDNRWKLLELAEKFWKEELADVTSRLDRARDEASSTNNEVYQILGFYSVFQGLLVGAAWQSQTLTCRNRDPLFGLCTIITVYALVGFFVKLLRFQENERYSQDLQQKRNQRKAQITRLRRENLRFEFAAPTLQKAPSKIRIWIIRVFLVLSIFAFSGAIIGCINWILCS